jgi:hypothetical protein
VEPDRSKLIVDDNDDETDDYEQSDMVRLLLNMGYLDDCLAKDVNFSAGISKKIAGFMIGKTVAARAFDKSEKKYSV